MTRLLYTVVLLVYASLAYAEDLPARFSVQGVASDDVLNIRAKPTTSSDIIGTLGPFAINVEVVRLSPDGKWGLVSAGERIGWISMRYVARVPGASPYEIPRPLTCLGTEPFWSLTLGIRGSEYQMMGEARQSLNEISHAVADRAYLATFEEGPTLVRTLLITREQCNDGMSNREFGFSGRLFTETPDGNTFHFGCCTLDLNR